MNRFVRSIIRVTITVSILLTLVFTLQACTGAGYYRVIGTSMSPTVQDKDFVIVFYSKSVPERGDIVTVRNGDILLIKRIIGIPGDHIVFIGDSILINSQIVTEYYIHNLPTYSLLDVRLNEDEYFVLGDNRDISYDSRNFGPVHRNDIVKVLGYYWRF